MVLLFGLLADNQVTGFMVTRWGKLVLLNYKNEAVMIPFDGSRDTLLFWQSLQLKEGIDPSVSSPKLVQGPFYVSPVSNGLAAFVQAEPPQKYIEILPPHLASEKNCVVTQVGFLNGSLNFSAQCNGSPSGDQFTTPKASYFQFLRLDFDGHLRIYEWKKLGLWEPVFNFSNGQDDCQYPLVCGEYGVCSEGQCSCPKAVNGVEYFREISSPFQKTGREAISNPTSSFFVYQDQLVDFGNLSYFTYIDPEAAIPNLKDLEGCKRACSRNVSCKAVFFRYENNSSDGYCYLPNKVFTIRKDPIHGSRYSSSVSIKMKVRKRLRPVIIIVGTVMIFIILSIVGTILLLKRRDDSEDDFNQLPGMPTRFSYQGLCSATKNFSEKLGGGGFGDVFKGTLGDGMEIAVKRLDNIGQGIKEFLAEIETIGKTEHINIVRLIGFCAEKSRRLLVYEYMSNGSLDKWVFRNDPECILDWKKKEKIVLDIAKGLAYLHEECGHKIAHLDIKPQNILLDDNFNAKVSDFGLSKVIDTERSRRMTTLRGTFGYLAPEWLWSKITLKADTYSFGIVVLKIVCGRKNLDHSQPESRVQLLSIIQKKAEEGLLHDIVHMQNFDSQCRLEEVMKMIRIGIWCLHDNPTRRPSMSTVVKVLEGLMELEPDISFRFSNAIVPPCEAGANGLTAPEADVLSGPR